MKRLRLILGDQLNHNHSWFQEVNDDVIYCFFEMRQETDYVKHHIQKVIGFFSAMRNFAKELKENGHQVIYYQINDSKNQQELTKNLTHIIQEKKIECFEYIMPDEYRLDKQLKEFSNSMDIETKKYDSEHFYTLRTELKDFFEGKKQYLMENFYRIMRKKHHVLMNGNQPEGGKWNFDQSNRKKWQENTTIVHHSHTSIVGQILSFFI